MSSQNSCSSNCSSSSSSISPQEVSKSFPWSHDGFPVLFIPNKFPNQQPYLYDVKTNAIYNNTGLQWDHHRRCCGSCFGWLATTDVHLALSFTNPFSGRTLKFPSISPHLYFPESSPYEHRIFKAILSKDPTLFPNDYLVIVIHYDLFRFSCIQPGAAYWVEIEDKGLRPFSDVIIYKGSVYAVSFYGGLGALDISQEDFDDSLQNKLQVIVPNNMKYAQVTYLVESSQGQLLQVRRFIGHDSENQFKRETWKFDVFMLRKDEEDQEQMKWKWVRVNTLGEDALFLGDNYSRSILASNFPNCNPNCIYFTDNYHLVPCTRLFDMGIYNLASRSFTTHYSIPSSHGNYENGQPPIWIQPI